MPAKRPTPADADSVARRLAHRAEFAGSPSEAAFAPDLAATVTGATIATLEAWRSVGRGPAFFRIGRQVRYTKRAIEQWMAGQDGHQPAPTPAPTPARRVAAKPARKGAR
jgi:hypothetical protein